MKRKLLVFALICHLALSCFAQQPAPQGQRTNPQPRTPQQVPPSDDDVVKITTNLVQLDPVITDKDGKIVTDLRADELEILEDGKSQSITNFSFVPLESVSRPAPPVARNPIDENAPRVPIRIRPEDVRRTIAVVVDDLGLSRESLNYARQGVKKFLDQQMEQGDLVAIIRTGGGIGVLQQFTSDKRQLYAALERVRFNPTSRAVGAFAAPTPDPLAMAGSAASAANGIDRERGGDVDELREDSFTVGTLGALDYIIRGLKDLPGRKSILLMSNGLVLYDFGRDNYRIKLVLERLIDQANRASVVIYAVDARGLETLNFTAGDKHINAEVQGGFLSALRGASVKSQGGLKDLTEATGGFAIVNTNDLVGGIRKVLDDQRGYYLIGYRPDDSTFERVGGRKRYHRISVRVKRPGKFIVRMRNGFYGVTQEERVAASQTPTSLLLGALTTPFGSSGVNVRLTSLFFNDPSLGLTMRSLLNIKASDLTFTEQPDGWHQSVIDLIAMTFGDNGLVVDQLSHTHTLRLKGKAYEEALKRGVTYSINVPIKKPGAYQLRAALRDVASNRVGSAGQFVEVPDIGKKRLTLSGLITHEVEANDYQQRTLANRNDGNSGRKESEDSDPISSAAVREFKSGAVVEYGLAIYNAQLDKSTARPQLLTQARLFRNGQLVFTGKEVRIEAGGEPDLQQVSASGAVQLGSQMEPGDYVLQVTVTDLLRKDRYRIASQWIDFEILK
jgi:VWFA-related protein